MIKILTLVLALATSTQAFAAFSLITCKQIDGSKDLVIILEQIGNDRIEEGKKIPFRLTIAKAPEDDREILLVKFASIQMVKDGFVQTEDVQFNFTSHDKSVMFGIYMDEENQDWMKINGKKAGQFNCKSLN
jgi:hypothetical protein